MTTLLRLRVRPAYVTVRLERCRQVKKMLTDEEVGHQILNIFIQHKIRPNGFLRRNNFLEVRDADFQRGLNKALENQWLRLKLHDRYTYILTEAGMVAGTGPAR